VDCAPLLKSFQLLVSLLDCFEVEQPVIFGRAVEVVGLLECYFSGVPFQGHPSQWRSCFGLQVHGAL